MTGTCIVSENQLRKLHQALFQARRSPLFLLLLVLLLFLLFLLLPPEAKMGPTFYSKLENEGGRRDGGIRAVSNGSDGGRVYSSPVVVVWCSEEIVEELCCSFLATGGAAELLDFYWSRSRNPSAEGCTGGDLEIERFVVRTVHALSLAPTAETANENSFMNSAEWFPHETVSRKSTRFAHNCQPVTLKTPEKVTLQHAG